VTRSIERMGKLVASRLKEVIDAYTASEVDRAIAVWARDTEVDEHYESLFRELLTYMMGDPRTITAGSPPAVRGQEPRTDRRPRHQYRRDRPLRDHRPELDRAPASSASAPKLAPWTP
jgi:hypothetical protein